MTKISLPIEFQKSYLEHPSYPQNLAINGLSTHVSILERYKKRLHESHQTLCLQDERYILVPFRDLNGDKETDMKKCNIHTEDKLEKWLGIDVSSNNKEPAEEVVSIREQMPKCRFIYLHSQNSRDQLRLTYSMLTKILTFHNVMPQYLDFILAFGTKCNERDLHHSNLLDQTMLDNPDPGLVMSNRSGRHFQLCYNLKGVTQKENNEVAKLNEWSIRSAAFLHQFDIVFGTTLWIVTKGRLDIHQRYKSHTGPRSRQENRSFATTEECFRSSLATHLMFCNWCTEDWRWYLSWLEEIIERESSLAIYGPRSPGHAYTTYKPDDVQKLQYWKEKAAEAAMVLESNTQVLKALRKYYDQLVLHRHFCLVECIQDVQCFSAEIDKIIDNLMMQESRAKFLETLVTGRKELILHHLQGQTSDRTEQLNIYLKREAIVMRIITMITLFYLPATFVSTFFSTGIFQFQDVENVETKPTTHMPVGMVRWLQVTVPLTLFTVCVSWLAYKRSINGETQDIQFQHKKAGSTSDSALHTFWRALPSLSKNRLSRLPLHNGESQTSPTRAGTTPQDIQ